MKNLQRLYQEHTGKVSDKWSLYLPEYDRLFAACQNQPIRLLEIGIQNGGSLEIWGKYFNEAQHLIGCDINPDCAKLQYQDSRISVVVGDANTDAIQQQIVSISDQFELIIDDGSHTSSDMIRSFAHYFQYLTEDGLFILEDMHCSYWQEFGGGLYDPYSSISFFKQLVDIINHEHWGIEKSPEAVLSGFHKKYGIELMPSMLGSIHSIEFIDSMCVIRKRPFQENTLGTRIIAGEEAIVEADPIEVRGTQQTVPSQANNPWSARAFIPMEEIEEQQQEIADLNQQIIEQSTRITSLVSSTVERDRKIASFSQSITEKTSHIVNLNEIIANRDTQLTLKSTELDTLKSSKSWKITEPLRQCLDWTKRLKRLMFILPAALQQGGGTQQTMRKALNVIKDEGLAGFRQRLSALSNPPPPVMDENGEYVQRNNYKEWVRRYDTLDDAARDEIRDCIKSMVRHPKISVVMPVYNPPLDLLDEAIWSVRRQLYTEWEFCIADDASKDTGVRELLEKHVAEDSRIKVVYRTKNGHISQASNSALEQATGEFIALLDNDDLLPDHALFYVIKEILANPDAVLIYSDEDKLDLSGKRIDAYFKPDWNPELFLGHNMISHFGVYRTETVKALGGFRVGYEGSQDYDLAARVIGEIKPTQIIHIPKVLYHWRMLPGSASMGTSEKPYAILASEKALNDYLAKQGIKGSVEGTPSGMHRVRFELPDEQPLVSIIIPTRNAVDLVRSCVTSVFNLTTYKNFEILLIDNRSDDPLTLAYFNDLEQKHENLRVIKDDRPFNFSALNNFAVTQANGKLVTLLNNDTEVIAPDWLSEMVSIALLDGIGAVGAKLYYPNDLLQHGGVILGLGLNRVAGHMHYNAPRRNRGYFGRASLTQELSAVTAACLTIRKDIYEKVGGFDENLTVAFNDIDFCLRVREAGYRNIWTPHAELYHHESISRGSEEESPEKQARFAEETHYMQQRWGEILLNDPAYNPNLTLDHGDFSLAWPPRETSKTESDTIDKNQ